MKSILPVVLCAGQAVLSAQTFTRLFTFNYTDGSWPAASLVQANDGGLYGTTRNGGPGTGSGTIFAISAFDEVKTIYSFGLDAGGEAIAPLVLGGDGYLYGATSLGGANTAGTLFKISTGGAFTVLYSFCQNGQPCNDGAGPVGLMQVAGGDFYGVTQSGGPGYGGTVFKFSGGVLTTLYTFCAQGSPGNCPDGATPWAGLVQASNGNFYGTTSLGGAHNDGTVFEITPQGALTTLYSFCSAPNCTDGYMPLAGLVQAANGELYGTTDMGGTSNDGTVFGITPDGVLTTLHSFCTAYECADGSGPRALTLGSDGNIYGTTGGGGANDGGTIYRLGSNGTLVTIFNFCAVGCPEGDGPYAGVTQSTTGDFYGTTDSGGDDNGGCYFYFGASGCGTVYKLSTGLSPFVTPVPVSGRSGTKVTILGNALTGASSVTFNGVPASFQVGSPTRISTTVPVGATSGTVQVVTPGGTLLSNVRFVVR